MKAAIKRRLREEKAKMGRRKAAEKPRKERLLKKRAWSTLPSVAEKFTSYNFLKMTIDYRWRGQARRLFRLKES